MESAALPRGETSCVNPQAQILFRGGGGGREGAAEAEAPADGATRSVRGESGERRPLGCVNAQPLSAGQRAVALQCCVLCGATG